MKPFSTIPAPGEVQNIIFDLGNVIVDLDLSATEKALSTLLKPDVVKGEVLHLFECYELGHFDESYFLQQMKDFCLPDVSANQIIDAWNAILLGVRPVRWKMLDQLRNKYQLLVLSNTNATHINWVHSDLRNNHNIFDFEGLFHQVYYSHLLHQRKPNQEIYHTVLETSDLDPKRTLFIDDNFDNIVSAAATGLMVYHHEIGAEIAEVLANY